MNSSQKNNLIKISLLVLFLITLAIMIYEIFKGVSLSNITISSLFYSLAQLAGLVGFFFISLLIISGDFARLFDSVFGIDRIIKTQRKFAIFTYFIVFSHPLLIILANNSSVKFLIPQFSILPMAAGTIAIYIFLGIMLSSLLYKRVSYKAWQYLHALTYILFVLILYHSLNAGSHVDILPIKIIYYALIALAVAGMAYRTSYKLRQRKNKFFLKEIKEETHDTFTLVVEPKQPVSFKPGQFFFLRVEGKKLYARHPFSVSNSANKYLYFTIKNTGRFTEKARNLKNGDEIKIEGPFGKFILESENKDLVFIAGGVGITPLMSMIKDNIHTSTKRNILLVYGSKTEKDILFKKELDSINENWFKKIFVLSVEKNSNYENGYIEEKILRKHIDNFNNKKYYICGPKAMMESIKKTLEKLGVNKEDIITEDFFW